MTYNIKDLNQLESSTSTLATINQKAAESTSSIKYIITMIRNSWQNAEGSDLESAIKELDTIIYDMENAIGPTIDKYVNTMNKLIAETRNIQNRPLEAGSYLGAGAVGTMALASSVANTSSVQPTSYPSYQPISSSSNMVLVSNPGENSYNYVSQSAQPFLPNIGSIPGLSTPISNNTFNSGGSSNSNVQNFNTSATTNYSPEPGVSTQNNVVDTTNNQGTSNGYASEPTKTDSKLDAKVMEGSNDYYGVQDAEAKALENNKMLKKLEEGNTDTGYTSKPLSQISDEELRKAGSARRQFNQNNVSSFNNSNGSRGGFGGTRNINSGGFGGTREQTVGSKIGNFVGDIGEGAANIAKGVTDMSLETAKSLSNGAIDIAGTMANTGIEVGSSLIKGIGGAAGALTDGNIEIAKTMANTAKDILEKK